MIYKLIDHMVKAFGREVIEQWIPLERLNITSLTDPEITLTNIPIPDKLFENPSIPLSVVKSNIGKVVIRCPWKTVFRNDGSVSLTVDVKDVDAVLRFKRIDEWNKDTVEKVLVETREKLLKQWNAAVSSLGLLSSKAGRKGSKAAGILNSLDLKVHNIKIMLADNMLYKEPFSITVEAEYFRGIGMQPNDPTLSEYERQGVADSMLNALWFTSSGVQLWLAIYHQDQEDISTEDGQGDNLFDHSDWTSTSNSVNVQDGLKVTGNEDGLKGPDNGITVTANGSGDSVIDLSGLSVTGKSVTTNSRDTGTGGEDTTTTDADTDLLDEFPSRTSSHLSDELFTDLPGEAEPGAKRTKIETSFWNFCTAPCQFDDYETTHEYRAPDVKPGNEGLMRVLQGPYKNYNITPPEGLTLDIVLKIWNMTSLVSMPNAAKQQRRSIQVSIRATEKAGTVPTGPPKFDGNTEFSPLDLVFTGAAAMIVYNIVRYMQFTSSYKAVASKNYNALPDQTECQRYIDIIKTKQLTKKEQNAEFVKEMELKTPFHKLLRMKQMANATRKRIVRDNVCFISVPCMSDDHSEKEEQVFFQESLVQSYTWYQWDMALKLLFPNLNVHLVPVVRIPGAATASAIIAQLSTFIFGYKTLSKRTSCDIGVLKPIVRLGNVRVATRKSSFSAKVMLRPIKDTENLLCYPDELISNVHSFFRNYGSDDIGECKRQTEQQDVWVNIEKFADGVKHLEVLTPKLVVILNALCSLGKEFWDDLFKLEFLTFESFVRRNQLYGHVNTDLVKLLTKYLSVSSSKTVVKTVLNGVIIRTLVNKGIKDIGGNDTEWRDRNEDILDQQNVCDRFILNDKMLNTWEYCEDIDDPFAFKYACSMDQESRSLTNAYGTHKTVYSKAEFLSEMDTITSSYKADFDVMAPEGYSDITGKSKLVQALGRLRKWYRNTCCMQLPTYVISELDILHSINVEVGNMLINYASESSMAYLTMSSALVECTNHYGATTELLNIKNLTLAKKRQALCIDLENIVAMLDAKIPIYKIALLVAPFRGYLADAEKLKNRLKSTTEAGSQTVYRDVSINCSNELKKILTCDFYTGSTDTLQDCSLDLMDALERKLHAVDVRNNIMFLSLGSVRINVAADRGLYEFLVHKVQVELCGKERLKLYVGNTALSMVDGSERTVILSSKTCELGKNQVVALDEVDNGQIMLDYRGKDVKYLSMEIRNIHHVVDICFVNTIKDIVKQFKTSSNQSDFHLGNLTGHIMVHHSSLHYMGIGAMVDVYATVNVAEPADCRSLSVEVPRFHVTFTSGLEKRAFALSLLDVVLELCEYKQMVTLRSALAGVNDPVEQEAKLINVVLELSHFAVWGFHQGPEETFKAQFDNVAEAGKNLELVLHETWFNHMTPATLPSYYDDQPVVLVPLVSTRYADAARLTPLLNHTWIKDWLEKATANMDYDQCDKTVNTVLQSVCLKSLQQRKRSLTKIAASVLSIKEIVVTIGSVDLVSMTAVLHRESIRHIISLFSKCELLRHRQKPESTNKMPKIFKVDVNIDEIEVLCPYNVAVTAENTVVSSLLPNAIVNTPMHKRRPKSPTAAFHILRIYSSPSVLVEFAAETTLMLQSDLTLHLVRTLYNNMKHLQGIVQCAFFDYVDVMEDARYQASRHLFDANDDEKKGDIITFSGHKIKIGVLIPGYRLEYWRDILKHAGACTTVQEQGPIKDFKTVLKLNLANLNSDIRLVTRNVDMVKATIQHLEIADAWGKYILEDLYGARCALGDMGFIDDVAFAYPADQFNLSLTTVNGLKHLKVILEHTRSEIQIDGISVILGVLQDLGLTNLMNRHNKSEQKQRNTLNIEINLNMHEIWVYQSVPQGDMDADTDGQNVASMGTKPATIADSEQKMALPRVIKRAREVEYSRQETSARRTLDIGASYEVVGCLISVSISHGNSGSSSVNVKYMGLALAKPSMINGLRVLVDERSDCVLNTLDTDERNLLELRESSIKTRELENGHLIVALQASTPKISINIDQLFQLCLLKPYILGVAVSTLKAHQMVLKGLSEPEDVEDSPVIETHDLMDSIRYVATKYNIPMIDPSDMSSSVYNVPPDVEARNKHALQVREKGHAVVSKMLDLINRLIWHDDDRQLTASLRLNDCKVVLFSPKNELVLTFNLHQMMFLLTHTAPISKKRTVVDSSMVFNVTTYNTRLDNHDTVVQTTVATVKVTYEDIGFDMPALDVNMQLSGLALEVNPCLLQLFSQLKQVSKMLSSENVVNLLTHNVSVKLYNELEVGVSLHGVMGGLRKKIDLMHLPTQRFTHVSDKEIYIFISSAPVSNDMRKPRNTLSGHFEALNDPKNKGEAKLLSKERESLLLGNSINVKSTLLVLRGHSSTSQRELDIDAISQAYPTMFLVFIGRYHLEQTGSRLFKVPDSLGLVLMEQFTDDANEPYIILSSSIRIQNSTDIPLSLHMDNRIGYLTKVAYKLTNNTQQSDEFEELYLEPYSSASIPLRWFGTAMMPMIAPIFSKEDTSANAVPFHYLYNLLNRNPMSETDVEPVKEVTLLLKGFLALKCTVVAKEAASTDDYGSCLYHFCINIEPMAKLVNMLPCEVDVFISLNRLTVADGSRAEEEYAVPASSKYTLQTRLKPKGTLGVPYSEQKLFMRVSVVGSQLRNWNPDLQTPAETLEYISPVFQVFLPSNGSVSIVKALKLWKGPINDMLNFRSEDSATWQSFVEQYKTMSITIDLSRHDIRLWWPFIFENMTASSLVINGRLLMPKARYYGNLNDASNCRVRALVATEEAGDNPKQDSHVMSQYVKLDVTSTTDFRPPIKFTVPLNKKTVSPLGTATVDMEVLDPVMNTTHIQGVRKYRNHATIPGDVDSVVNNTTEEALKASDTAQNISLCLGSTVRYAEYPYDMCKIVSITDMYTFVNKLPFAVCVRGASINSQHTDSASSDDSSDLVLLPGDALSLNTIHQGAYVVNIESGITSGIFSLHYPRVPYMFQVELNSQNVTYSTVATRGLLIQINVISGMFKGAKMPYSYNGYYFVLSLPNKPQHQILNLTKYKLAYSVPENMKSTEAQMVDNYDSAEQGWQKSPMNKIGILPPTCITHYVPAANEKSQESPQVCLKVLHVDSSTWSVQQLDSGRERYQTIKFVDKGANAYLYATIIIRSNGTRIFVVVESKMAAIELNRIGGCATTNGPKLQWSNINFNFLTPRITVTVSTKRRVILALHLTNTSIGVTIAPSNSDQVITDKDGSDTEAYRSNIIEFDGVIQSIHIDHFLQGYIPVILKSSAKRSSTQDSFLHCKVLLSNFMALGLPVYDLIHVKMSPVSINIETAVIEQLIGSMEAMIKRPIGNVAVSDTYTVVNDIVVTPEPKWVEMEPTLPVYIRKLTVDPITLSLSIRTSSVRLTHHTMRILDALPLDTPCVCVHFAREARSSLILGWGELMHSLRNSYLRQLIRQSLPSAWLSNIFAVLHRLYKGLMLLLVQPVQSAIRFKNIIEGFLIGVGSGIMLFLLYMVGGTTLTLGHILNVFHKIVGGQRSKPQGVLDALWLGLNALFLHVFYIPWKRLYTDFSESQSSGDGVWKTSVGLAVNLARAVVSPVIGVVNMLITIIEGFSNVLLGDFEQFAHVYESDQLGNAASAPAGKHTENRDVASSDNQLMQRIKTSMAIKRQGSSKFN
ncbi:amine-terminal region of A TM vesicle-mediated sorter [Babesia ovis]|uniref:Amine-terminal region of A TM vesicle-mediated sorter n=1 Tax=Babesia ovis TaxID=5869 RepID=A0A9W5TBP5_BABOV|nr:amine-terminal region of A TM vesicle-mediated sorter [Babesia ovis]